MHSAPPRSRFVIPGILLNIWYNFGSAIFPPLNPRRTAHRHNPLPRAAYQHAPLATACMRHPPARASFCLAYCCARAVCILLRQPCTTCWHAAAHGLFLPVQFQSTPASLFAPLTRGRIIAVSHTTAARQGSFEQICFDCYGESKLDKIYVNYLDVLRWYLPFTHSGPFLQFCIDCSGRLTIKLIISDN